MPPANTKHDFVCYGCGAEYPEPARFACKHCGEPLGIRSLARPDPALFTTRPRSMWAYRDLLPIASKQNEVSLEEGATPLVDAPRLAAEFGFKELLIKNEMANPTGSFKDRQVSAGISHAKEIGARTVAVVSSGNVACATSAYAARAGMKAMLLMHGHAALGKIAQAAVYGGLVVRVDTPAASAVFDLCIAACRAFGWYHLSTAGMYEPFNVEGAKTIAYELYCQTQGNLPDWIVAPVGGGGLLGGVWRGFLDLKRLGLIERLPRLAGVQAFGCAPLKKAIEAGTRYLDTLKDPWPNPKTIAGGIADDILFDGHTALPAVRTTDGAAIAVDDVEIVQAQRTLALREGLWCESTAAVSIAALRRLPDAGKNARVCALVTGNGMKDLAAAQAHMSPVPAIAPSLEALERLVRDA
jgi:threonine synthase